MKKIILIIFASLMFTNIGFAEIKLIEKEKDIGFNGYRYCNDWHTF